MLRDEAAEPHGAIVKQHHEAALLRLLCILAHTDGLRWQEPPEHWLPQMLCAPAGVACRRKSRKAAGAAGGSHPHLRAAAQCAEDGTAIRQR